MEVLGIDVGGSGIKGAVVDTVSGELITERQRIRTPRPSTPQAVIAAMAQVVKHFEWQGLIGCGFPAVVKSGVVHTATNISKKWLGVQIDEATSKATECRVVSLNDGDAAGLAEMRFGAGRGRDGVVLVLTLGTGIGIAPFVDGKLMPNTEFGHLETRGMEAEDWAADIVRKQSRLSWKKWAKRVNEVLNALHILMWPDLVIIGGGVSKEYDKFFPFLNVPTEVVPALLRNDAGIVGAALAAEDRARSSASEPLD